MKLWEVMSCCIVSTDRLYTHLTASTGRDICLSQPSEADRRQTSSYTSAQCCKHTQHTQSVLHRCVCVCVCVCVCAVGSDLTSHVRTPSGSHQHTCWRRAEWVPCLTCRHTATCQQVLLSGSSPPGGSLKLSSITFNLMIWMMVNETRENIYMCI